MDGNFTVRPEGCPTPLAVHPLPIPLLVTGHALVPRGEGAVLGHLIAVENALVARSLRRSLARRSLAAGLLPGHRGGRLAGHVHVDEGGDRLNRSLRSSEVKGTINDASGD